MQHLRCAEILGGIGNQDQDVCSNGLTISLYSSASDGGKGGDIHYLSLCAGDKITRIALADVVGHGQAVSDVSQWMYDSLQARMNSPEGGAILQDMNRLALDRGHHAITTAAVVGYYLGNSNMYFSYAGHHPALIRRRGEREWRSAKLDGVGERLANLPLGVAADVAYDEAHLELSSGDRVFVYTDGVIEAPDSRGQLFGERRLRSVLEAAPDADPMELKSAVLAALRGHTGGGLAHDDVTLMAVEVR